VTAGSARRTMANQPTGKASSDSPALKPYRGKLAVRNFRGGDGNVGIIRSPISAIALPDRKISDGGGYLPGCALRIYRNHRGSLWPPFHPCSAPSGPALGLVAAVRGGHLQLDHGWNCAQSTTDHYNKCVKLARAWLRTRSGRQPKVRIRQQRLAARITALCDIRHCNPTQSVYAVNVSL
jgi:hypothetical protein